MLYVSALVVPAPGYLEAPAPLPYARHAFGTRLRGGALAEALPRAEADLGLPTGAIAHMGQVHGAVLKEATHGGLYEACDGIWTTQPGLWLAVKTADCTPVLVSSPKAVAALHLGWRSTQAGLLAVAVQALTTPLGQRADELHVAIGPSLSQQRFEVEASFGEAFPVARPERFFTPNRPGHVLMDLGGIIRAQAEEQGVPAGHIQTLGLCTYGEEARFFSYRRDKTNPGRQLSLICRA